MSASESRPRPAPRQPSSPPRRQSLADARCARFATAAGYPCAVALAAEKSGSGCRSGSFAQRSARASAHSLPDLWDCRNLSAAGAACSGYAYAPRSLRRGQLGELDISIDVQNEAAPRPRQEVLGRDRDRVVRRTKPGSRASALLTPRSEPTQAGPEGVPVWACPTPGSTEGSPPGPRPSCCRALGDRETARVAAHRVAANVQCPHQEMRSSVDNQAMLEPATSISQHGDRVSPPAGREALQDGSDQQPGEASAHLEVPAARETERRFRRSEHVVVGLSLAGRAWLMLLGYFVSDDWEWMQAAARSDLGWEFLGQDWHGHLQPFSLLVAWLATHNAPLNFFAAMMPVWLMLTLTTVMLLMLMRRLVSPGWARLGFLTFFCVTPLPVAALTWWAAALEMVPLQLALIMALYAIARAATGSRWWILACLAAFLAGLFVREKSLVIMVPVLGLLAVMALRGDVPRPRALRIGAITTAVLGATSVAYLALYAATRESPVGGNSGWRGALDAAIEAVFNGLAPALIGGPWRAGSQALDIWIDPPMGAIQTGLLVATAVVAASIVVNRRVAVVSWLVVTVYLGVEIAAVAVTRTDGLGPTIGRDTRYLADAGIVIALFGALAWSGVHAAQLRTRLAAPPFVTHPWIPAGLIIALALSSFGTTWHFGRAIHSSSVRPVVTQALADIEGLDNPVLFDGGAAPGWAWPLTFADGRISHFFVAAGADVRFDEPTRTLHMMTNEGHVVEAEIGKGFDSLIGPVPGCGWKVTAESPTLITMAPGGYPWIWGVRVNYLAGRETTGVVGIGTAQYDVTFDQGPGALFLVHRGPVTPLVVSVNQPGTVVCVDQVRFGDIHPADNEANNG